MGCGSWPISKTRYVLPKRFNVSIDGTGIFYVTSPSILLHVAWFNYLITRADEVCLVFDGAVPKQKNAERFKRKRGRAAFQEYFRETGNENDPIYMISQFTREPLLVEKKCSYGEGEHKMLMCPAWKDPTLPILCLVNDNDFFQFLIHVPPYPGKIGQVKYKENFLQFPKKSGPLNIREFTCSEAAETLNYYKVDSTGVLDFWHDYSFHQRKQLLIWTTILWGNDYLVGIAPTVKWETLVENIPDEKVATFEELVNCIINCFKFLRAHWPNKITEISSLKENQVPPQFGTVEEFNKIINLYLEQIIWSIVYILVNQNEPGEFSLCFPKEGIKLHWECFSKETVKINPILPLIGHCTNKETYYNLNCVYPLN